MRIFSLVVAVLALAAGTAAAQSWQPPAESSRCPSKWGPQDERGSGNHMRPDTVMRAARLIQTGQVFELGHVLSPTMPFFPGRRFDLLTKRTNVNPGLNHRGSNEEIVFTELGQVGTQFDGFSHQTIGDRLYNCFSLAEISSRTGFSKLGIEHVGALMTRGVLIDVAALKGAEMLPDGYEITAEDLQQALQRREADAPAGRRGHHQYRLGEACGRWTTRDTPRGRRGSAWAPREWLVRQDPMLVGSDNMAVEVNPNPDTQLSLPVHQIMLVVNGIHIVEALKLDEVAAARAYEFAFVVQPLKIQGATGSTIAPIAIR